MGRMWLALRQVGLPLKKKRSTHKSKTVKPRSAAATSLLAANDPVMLA
jgi:hypothetical protein